MSTPIWLTAAALTLSFTLSDPALAYYQHTAKIRIHMVKNNYLNDGNKPSVVLLKRDTTVPLLPAYYQGPHYVGQPEPPVLQTNAENLLNGVPNYDARLNPAGSYTEIGTSSYRVDLANKYSSSSGTLLDPYPWAIPAHNETFALMHVTSVTKRTLAHVLCYFTGVNFFNPGESLQFNLTVDTVTGEYDCTWEPY